MIAGLEPLFNPRGVVLIGASSAPEKLGYGIARNLVGSAYRGAIHFVSQKPGELFGHRLFTDLAEVPEPLDLAVLAVPNTATPDAIQACARRGIRVAILVSAGFREAGPDGVALEQRCRDLARQSGMRLLGPNCIGTIDTRLPLDTTFLQPPMPAAGGIAFLSHSGAFCAAIIDWSRQQGFGFSQIVSLGNQADLNETELLPEVAHSPHTRVIVLYLESLADGPRFVAAGREVTRHKPVVALKVGRSPAGQRAAASHTGALAASDRAFDAAFVKAGIFRAETAEQLFDWARVLERCPLPRGRAVAVLTDAGGPGVMAADALEAAGLHLAAFQPPTLTALAARLPAAASAHNPVDMLASASPQDYAACLQLLLLDTSVEAVLVILPPPPMFSTESVAEAVIPLIRSSEKPVVVALLGSDLTARAFERFNQAGVVTFPFPERAASALGILARRAESIQRRAAPGMNALRPDLPAPGRADLSAEDLVAAYGIPYAPTRLAKSAGQTAALAAELGYPVVLKIASPDILHKSDVGGVLLNISNAAQARNGYTKMMAELHAALPGADLRGVHVQHQVEIGQEVIVGMLRDETFGPLLMFGSGGVEAEGLKDVVFALGPLGEAEADELISSTWAGKKLAGFRNIPAADRQAVRDILVRLSWLAEEHAEVKELELNPVRVLARGALAVDLRLIRA